MWIPLVVARVWGEGTGVCQEVEALAGPWFADEIADVGVFKPALGEGTSSPPMH